MTSCIDEPPEVHHPNGHVKDSLDAAEYAFVLAAQEGMTDTIEAYLQGGMDVNARVGGTTALINAARFAHLETVELLLREGADKNSTDVENMTALMWAQRGGHVKIVEELKRAGSDGGS